MPTTATPRTPFRKTLTVGAGALATAATIAATLLAAAPAQAAPTQPYGTVTARTGLNMRQFPSTDSSTRGVLAYHQQVGLQCKVRAQYIDGNTVWYRLRTSHNWISARYVANTGYVPYCKDVLKSDFAPDLAAQHAMG
ncbi:SH3 domain-containing protein [Streptomyces sp. NPDC051320]|uniref:SH3 domain-containing protein n=1 Tax=Streptomyces sp. NPDC051320 TaxID=3154644 RepID=UPI00344003F4